MEKKDHVAFQRRPFLTPIWLTALAVAFSLGFAVFAAWVWGTAGSTIVIVIRHAEKDVSVSVADPPLAQAGEARAAQMAKEMRDIAAQLETGRVDASLLDRQQKLFHRLLDAGLTLQKDEREDTGKREAESAINPQIEEPANTNATGRALLKYPEPTWSELRGLTAEERQSVMEYFKRINAEP